MRKFKKAVAVLLTAAMTMSASIMAFADSTITFHFQDAKGWGDATGVGGYIFEGISWKTNCTDNSAVTNKKADGTVKKLWPGAKCTKEGGNWYKCTATFSDDLQKNGMVFKFNNFVGDAKDGQTQESDDTAAIMASGIPTIADHTKEETEGIMINKSNEILTAGVPTDIYVEFDGKKATATSTAPKSYTDVISTGTGTAGGTDTTGTGSTGTGSTDTTGTGTATGTGTTGTGTSSSTTAPTTGDTVAVTVVMFGLLAAVAFVASKKKVNA